ncbi:MAG TPA: prolyl oligopeptidase family serine peptidase [Candidatus Acidoferrales bacterium]|nr:prolyl oligopeptidase family serine peptidase [Candidatus Acidoferrales bacterium]
MRFALRSLVAISVAALIVLTRHAWHPALAQSSATAQTDPYLWLEDKDGARALAWVKEQNAKSLPVLEGDAHYAGFYRQALKIYQSQDRIPYPEVLDGMVYNFWQDAQHVHGIWRRTTIADYRTAAPHWTTVLDLDALAKSEHVSWVWKGDTCDYPRERYCLLSLSNGGEDAVTVREFDLRTASFVPNGFLLPRGKQIAAWEDHDTLLVSREWAPGDLTTSGYPYVVKRLKRGAPLSSAVEVFRGERTDQVYAFPTVLHDGAGNTAVLIQRTPTFFTIELHLETPQGLKRLGVPPKSELDGMVAGRLLFSLNQPWNVAGKSFPQGSLVAVDLRAAQADPSDLHPTLVYAPGPREAIVDGGVAITKDDVLVSILDNVRGRELVLRPLPNDRWSAPRELELPENSTVSVGDTNLHNDLAFVNVTSFLTPSSLYLADASTTKASKVKSLPPQFDASNEVVEQHEATSKDGTQIPYFIVHPKNMRLTGMNPTVLYAYGGFQISMTPFYSGVIGKLWLEHGGVYVLANIRGGGEFGPAWHDAALTIHRQRAYDDFYAVAQDLIARKVTSTRYLGIMGGSNGGLLMGVEFTEHPDEYHAVVIQVPLLDMIRIGKIEAGASWAGEYGDLSDPKVLAFWEKTSPYQNLREGVKYPEPFIWTKTKDDRVGPQHARKFAAKLAAMGDPYLFYEATEGGHAAGATLKESARTQALQWTYLTMKLME